MQDQYNVSYGGEHLENMNTMKRGVSMGDAERSRHKETVDAKVIKSTSLTERRDEVDANANVMKAFGRAPKIDQNSKPNAVGNVATAHLYKQGVKGPVKGGIKYK